MFVFLRGRSVKLFDADQLFFALKGEESVFLYELLKKEKREICSIGKIFDIWKIQWFQSDIKRFFPKKKEISKNNY